MFQVTHWVHGTNSPLHSVYLRDEDSSKRTSLTCQKRSIFKNPYYYTKNKKTHLI